MCCELWKTESNFQENLREGLGYYYLDNRLGHRHVIGVQLVVQSIHQQFLHPLNRGFIFSKKLPPPFLSFKQFSDLLKNSDYFFFLKKKVNMGWGFEFTKTGPGKQKNNDTCNLLQLQITLFE